ncbi:MAG TPA: AAA family ATPase [Flavobacteriales bacterium]
MSTIDPVSAFQKRLLHHMGHAPTHGQERLFYAFTRFVFSQKPRCSLLVKGYAGTGKTTCVSAMVRTLMESGINVVLLAPTGRAAKVLGNYSGQKSWTIHKQIYIRKSDRAGNSWFELKENELTNTVFFVDEASMIGLESMANAMGDFSSGSLLDDLIRHVYSGEGCRLVLIGDGAQLPPVGSAKSPALELDFLRSEYDLNIAEVELTEVIRQKEGSGILENATRLRNSITTGKSELPSFTVVPFKDVVRVNSDLQQYMEDALAEFGKEDTIIITRSNKRANLFNQQMRARILDYEEEINSGDRMIVLKNNYYWLADKDYQADFIANGDVITIQRVRSFEDRGAFRFCKAVVKMPDYPDMPEFETILLCNAIWEESASLSFEKMKELAQIIAQDYPDIENVAKLRKAIKEDPYYNALQVKFAYAITCHKAQGGQWPCVFVDQGYLTDEMAGVELNRWFYTAFTRARQKLMLVGFEDKMFDDKNE